jgi:hypothetical protein
VAGAHEAAALALAATRLVDVAVVAVVVTPAAPLSGRRRGGEKRAEQNEHSTRA